MASKIQIRNTTILILFLGAGFVAMIILFRNFNDQLIKDRNEYLDQNLQKAVLEFREDLEQYANVVAGIRSFNYEKGGKPDGLSNHNYLKEALKYSSYEKPIITSFLDTSHTFIYSVSNTELSPNDLVGTQLSSIRDTYEILNMSLVMQGRELVATNPINLYEGFAGLPINFGIRVDNVAIGYVATVMDVKNIIEPIIKRDVKGEFTYQFIYGNGLFFDREKVYDGNQVFHNRVDTLNLHFPADEYQWARVDALQSIFHIGIAYRNSESSNTLIPFIQRSAVVIGILILLLGILVYLFLQQIGNTKTIKLARNKAETMNEVLMKFISAVSYDLKNPMDNIKKQLYIIRTSMDNELDDDVKNRLKLIQDNATQLDALMDDFLSYAEIVKHEKAQEIVDLNLIIEQIQAYYSDEEVEILSEPLPKTIGSKSQLDKLFRQLISNGIKFNQRPIPRIVISSEFLDNRFQVRVSDDGIGIKSEYLSSVFDDFNRLDSEHYAGTGLGLAISREIVQNHGGNIRAEINSQGGTDIVFDLPKTEVSSI